MRILGVSNWAWLFEIGDGLLEYWGIISCTGSWYEFLPTNIEHYWTKSTLKSWCGLGSFKSRSFIATVVVFHIRGKGCKLGSCPQFTSLSFQPTPSLFQPEVWLEAREKNIGCGATRVSPEHRWRPAPKVLAVPAKQGSQRVISRHGVVPGQEMVRGSQAPCVAPVCNFTSLGEAKLQMWTCWDRHGSVAGHRTEDVAQSSALCIESVT